MSSFMHPNQKPNSSSPDKFPPPQQGNESSNQPLAFPGAGVSGSFSQTKRVFTTGEAADICKISQQTVIRCFDAGRLGGFRVPGSKFRRIPRAELLKFMKANSIPLENLTSFEGSAAAFENDFGPRRILVVDDDAAIRDMFRDLLASDSRFDVKFAASGYEAGLLTESFRPHLIVLDYMLPDINGDAVCQRLRESDHLKHTKVLFVSGVVSQAEIERLVLSGASGFVAKPFDITQLLTRVNQLLDAAA